MNELWKKTLLRLAAGLTTLALALGPAVSADRILCTEPSPNVAQALIAAFVAAQRGDGSAVAGVSSAEGVAQLGERLATIQLLRDGLYRTCEAYRNGAISQTTYALIVSRSDRVAIALLSSEMAAGAFGRELAAISGSVSSSVGEVAKKAKLEKARYELTAATQELAARKATLAAAKRELVANPIQETQNDVTTSREDPARRAKVMEVERNVASQQVVVDAAKANLQHSLKAFVSTFAEALAQPGSRSQDVGR